MIERGLLLFDGPVKDSVDGTLEVEAVSFGTREKGFRLILLTSERQDGIHGLTTIPGLVSMTVSISGIREVGCQQREARFLILALCIIPSLESITFGFLAFVGRLATTCMRETPFVRRVPFLLDTVLISISSHYIAVRTFLTAVRLLGVGAVRTTAPVRRSRAVLLLLAAIRTRISGIVSRRVIACEAVSAEMPVSFPTEAS